MRSFEEDEALADIRVIASDMDLTLLADDGSLPPNMDERIRALDAAGLTFAAASGRPLYTLRDMFGHLEDRMAYISDNGAAVLCRGEVIYKSLLGHDVIQELTEFTLGRELGIPTVCGLDACYIRECDRAYDSVFRVFYHNIEYVDSLDHLGERLGVELNKFTVYFPGANAVAMRDTVYGPEFGERLSVTCGGAVWIDIMNHGVDKGTGVARLCDHLGISVSDVAACGDTDNDAEMLEAVGHGYLVANAPARMERFADFRIPSNNDRGVAQVIDAVLAARGA